MSLVTLKNKFQAVNSFRSAEDKGTRGAIQIASQAGALFNNKDGKNGYQTSADYFFEVWL